MEELTKIEEIAKTNPEAFETLREAMGKRGRAHALQAEVDMLQQEADEEIQMVLLMLGLSSINEPQLGTVTYVSEGKTLKFDKELFKTELLNKGVGADIIGECQQKATKTGSRKGYVRYEPPKTT